MPCRRSRLARLGGAVSVTVVLGLALAGSPAPARVSRSGSRGQARSLARASSQRGSAAETCPETSPSYDGPCGPLFTTPQWADGTSWDLPSEYETIQLARLDGSGEDLIGRNSQGLWVERFDRSTGQWELVGNADGGLAFPLPDRGGWNQPQYYRTIQTADLNGDGRADLLVRAADGLHVLRWNPQKAAFTDISKPPYLLSNAAGGSQPSVYETIQTADLFGDGHAELLARTPKGIEYARWNENTGHWVDVTQTGIAPDAHGGTLPSLYSSIQTGDVAGDGKADLLLLANGLRWYVRGPDGRYHEQSVVPALDNQHGFSRVSQYETVHAVRLAGQKQEVVVARAGDGLHVYRLKGKSWEQAAPVLSALSDANGFDRPSQYRTIRVGDVTGPGALDVLAHTSAGIAMWELRDGRWVTLATGLAFTGPVWDQASHYDTIGLGDITGDGTAALIARGVFGMRTFTWQAGAFRRPLPYGDFPSFSGAEAAAYAEVSRLLLDRAGDFRKETYASPQSAITEATLNAYRGRLAERCTPVGSASVFGSPPRYRDCVPPPGSSVDVAAWTAVSNQIIDELWAASGVVAHFSILDTIQTKLFQDQQGMLPALAADLTLPPNPPDRAPVFLKLIRASIDILSNLSQFHPDVINSFPRQIRIVSLTAQALGAVADGLGLRPEASPPQPYAKIVAETIKIQQRERDITQAQRRYVLADYGLLSVVGQEVKGRLLLLDETAALSSGREAFARWVTQIYLPVYWRRYQVVNCAKWLRYDCNVPNGSFVHVTRRHDQWTDFHAVFVGGSGCKRAFLDTYCVWHFPVGATYTRITAPVSEACRYDPTPGSTAAWRYGCSLGSPARDLIDGTNGWNLPVSTCDAKKGTCRSVTQPQAPASTASTVVGGALSARPDN